MLLHGVVSATGLPTKGIFPLKRKFVDLFGLWGIREFLGEF
jgi:hypothetical protein